MNAIGSSFTLGVNSSDLLWRCYKSNNHLYKHTNNTCVSVIENLISSIIRMERREGYPHPIELERKSSLSGRSYRPILVRTPSSPIYLSEEIHKPVALSRVFLLSSGRKSIVLVKKKAPSRSSFPLSMYVVLKTRHVNPNIHVRRYLDHVRSPNFSTTRPQLLSLRGATTYI